MRRRILACSARDRALQLDEMCGRKTMAYKGNMNLGIGSQRIANLVGNQLMCLLTLSAIMD
jgi:hypothetical protein